MSESSSRIFLPLRTSVDLFSDPTQPSALTRAKQAAVLHDEMIVEVGFYDVSLTENGGAQMWIPPEHMGPDHAKRARQPPEVGGPMTLAFAPQPAPGVPANPEDMQAVVQGPISLAYGAEWHSEALEPLSALGADFVTGIVTGGDDPFDPRSELGEAFRRQNSADWFDKTLMADMNTFRRDFIRKAFTRDALIADDLDAVVQVSTLFAPMLERHGYQATGTTAAQIVAPNLEAVAWEQVLEIRAHPGVAEARGMLQEWERVAVEQEPGDAQDFLLKVSQQANQGMLAALEDQRPKLGVAVIKEAVMTAIGFIPVVGPFIGGVVGIGEATAAKVHDSRSGIAALMKLSDPQ